MKTEVVAKKCGVFNLPIDLHDQDIAIFVGLSFDESLTKIKKRFLKWFINWFDDSDTRDIFSKIENGRNGGTAVTSEPGDIPDKIGMFLVLPRNTTIPTIMHECVHLAHMIAIRRGFTGEMEHLAYLSEYMFKYVISLYNSKKS